MTMMTSAITKGSPVRIEIAAAPNTELIPSQPMQLIQFSRPGTTIALAVGEPRQRHLGHAGLRAHRGQQADEDRADEVADDDRRERRPEARAR